MRQTIIIFMLVILFFTCDGYSQKTVSPWKPTTQMKTPRSAHMMAVANGKIYVIGGLVEEKKSVRPTTSVEMYDPRTAKWSRKADLPAAVTSAGIATLGGTIYVVGGDDVNTERSAEMVMYDCEKDEWSVKAPMHIARTGHAVVAHHGTLYAIGGRESNDEIGSKRKSALAVYTIERYDTATNEWTINAQLPFKHFTLGAVVVNDRIYILSDSTDERMTGGEVILEEYDPLRNSLQAKEKLIKPKHEFAIAAGDNRFFLFGGWQNGASKTVEEYDLVLDQWTWKSPLPFPVYRHRAVALDGKIYLAGGIQPKGKSAKEKKSDMMIYIPGADKVTEMVR